MWRCFHRYFDCLESGQIFSTYVEVFLLLIRLKVLPKYFLHVCGGVSEWFRDENLQDSFSPRMWRCFSCAYVARYVTKIFSTYVEVFLRSVAGMENRLYFLHVCGGVSAAYGFDMRVYGFSPRMWGCFQVSLSASDANAIFSTYVEVFPNISCYLIKKTLFTRCSVTEGK